MRLTNPFILLIAALGLIATLLTINPIFENRQRQVSQAKRAYQEAVFVTESQLVNLLRGVSENSVLTQNLNWGLDHSVSKALEASLRSGELDEVALIDANCNMVAKAAIKDSVIKNCPLNDIPVKKLEQFIWLKAGKFPTLGLVLPFKMEGKGELFLAGYVHLNDDWLELHGPLYRATKTLSLKIESEGKDEKGRVLMREGLDRKGHALAALTTKDFLLNLMPRLMLPKPLLNSALIWHHLLLAFALAAFAWWQSNVSENQAKKAKAAFLENLQTVLKQQDPECQNIQALDNENLQNVCEPVNASFEKSQEKIRILRRDLQTLKETIKARDFALVNKSQKIDDMAAYESLASQLKDSSRTFFDKMNTHQSQAEDIADVLAHGLNRNAQALSGFMEHWLKEIEERGSRRFFRYLSETPGSTQETFLDEQIRTFHSLSQDLATQSISATMHAQKLAEGLREATKQSEHWRGLTNVKTAAPDSHSLIDMVLEAQKLMRQRSPDNLPRFVNPFDLSNVQHLPKSPKASFVSSLYHVYLVLAAVAKANNITDFEIQNHLKISDKRASFIVTLETFKKIDGAIKLNDEAQKNLDIATRLLSIHDIHCQRLPGFDQGFVVAMSWEKTINTSTSKKAGAESAAGLSF